MRKNILSIITGLALVFLLTLLPTVLTFAEESMEVVFSDEFPSESYYTVKVTVKVTEDADGWNDAYITIKQKGRSGTLRQTSETKISGLKSDFDDKSEFSYEKTAIMFPGAVDIYTDFGGGATWRAFQADVTVYVNGVNVASKHITAKSSAFSSSNAKNTITIDESKYPYPVKMFVNSLSETEVSARKTCQKLYYVSMVDQYGASWNSEEITLKDSNGTDLGNPQPQYAENYFGDTLKKYYFYYANINVSGPDDQKITYTWNVPTGNSVKGVVSASYQVTCKFQHKVDLVIDDKIIQTLTGISGDQITLEFPELVGDGYDIEWELQGGGVLNAENADGATYVFGKTDGTLTGRRVPYSFTVVFDGNGATTGTMNSRIQRVGTTYTLPGNTFTNTGYDFTGWNTQPDGSGQAIPNKGTVTNLSTEKGDTVTLYAQWKPKTYVVTFVNKMTGERMPQEVVYGQDAVPPEIAPFAANEDDHYIFSGWNKSFSSVKSKITVTSVHEKEPHDFVQGDVEKYCTVCGYSIPLETDDTEAGTTDDPSEAASIFGKGSMIVIIICAVAAVIIVAIIVIIRHKKKGNQ